MRQLLTALAWMFLLALAGNQARADWQPLQEPQLRIETGMHTASIWRIGVSGDGKLIATASDDKTVRLWAANDGRLIRTFRVPIGIQSEGRLYSIAISPDGRLIAAGGWDHNYWQNYWSPHAGHYVYVFDTISGALVKRLGPLNNVVYELRFSPDGAQLAAGLGGNSGLRVWKAPFDRLGYYDMAYAADIFGLDFAPDGRLATASADGFVRLYDSNGALLVKEAAPGGNSPRQARFSPDGERLAVTQLDLPAVDILSGHSLAPIAKLDTSKYNTNLLATAWDADGTSLYAAGGSTDAEWRYPVVAWKGVAPVEFTDPLGSKGGINNLQTMPGGGVLYAAHDPSFGYFDSSGKLKLAKNQVTADMRNKYGGLFWHTPNLHGVWFGLQIGSIEPWYLDLDKLSFNASPQAPQGLIEPVTTTLNVQNWTNAVSTSVDNVVLPLGTNEYSRSLAIAPDKQSFALGTDWGITKFGADGKQLWKKYVESFAWGVSLSADGQILIAALGDGTLRWYRYSDGAELLSFFVHVPDKRWIAWTPKGYYAASPGGEDLIGWHVNGQTWDQAPDFFPASRFREKFYRPDIVQLVLQFTDEAKAIETADMLAGRGKTADAGALEEEQGVRSLLPAVVEFVEDGFEIETDKRDIELRYRLRSPSGRTITRVDVLIDGRPVTARGVVAVDESLDAKVIDLAVPERDSEVTLIAYIDDQASVPVTMPVKWKGRKVDDARPNLYALMIGVSEYENADLKLKYAAKDAQDLAAELEKQKGHYYGEVEVKLLLNRDATEDNIEAELARLKKKSKPDDIVIVFMAGHGMTDTSQDFYFLPSSVDLSPDMLAATAIDGDIIRKGLSKIPGKVILFMDACHSGNGIQGGVSKVDMTGVVNGISDGASVVMFASSTGREVSYEGPQWENGAFTEALLAVIEDREAYGEDGKLSISELDEQLTTRVEELTEGKQTPVMTKPGAIKRFFFASL